MTRHRFHGDPARFEVVARFIADRFPDARYVADVAGGQGMLTRILRKRFGFEAEVVDPRGWALKGVPARAELYTPSMADYYDLVVGHLAHLLPIRDAIVLRCEPRELDRRLRQRGVAAEPRAENVTAEATDLILLEAIDRRRRIWEIDTTRRTPRAMSASS